MDEVIIKRKGNEFHGYTDVTNINDSLLLDSGTVICEYITADKKIKAAIEVCGEVKLFFYPEGMSINDDHYDICRYPSDYPDELVQIIKDGKLSESDKVYIDFNNWFELFLYDEDGRYLTSDVVDVENDTFEAICDQIEEYIADYRKEYEI